jgi:hypothetical protein
MQGVRERMQRAVPVMQEAGYRDYREQVDPQIMQTAVYTK